MSHPENLAHDATLLCASDSSLNLSRLSAPLLVSPAEPNEPSRPKSFVLADGNAETIDDLHFYRVGLPPAAFEDADLLLPGVLTAANFVRQWLPDQRSCAHRLAFQLIVPKTLACVFRSLLVYLFVHLRVTSHDSVYETCSIMHPGTTSTFSDSFFALRPVA